MTGGDPLRHLVLVTGTGTGIGKTHLAEAILLAFPRDSKVLGLKPLESGVVAGEGPRDNSGSAGEGPRDNNGGAGEGPRDNNGNAVLSDADRLARGSTFHVQHFRVALRTPVAPSLAARREGVVLDIGRLRGEVARVRDLADVTLVELPGGLFSPFVDRTLNVDFAASLGPDATLLVAPDRLGVIHDVVATVSAARARGFRLDTLALVAPEQPDASTGTNAEEIASLLPDLPVLSIPRGAPEALARTAELQRLATELLPPPPPPPGDRGRAPGPGRPDHS